MTLTHFPPTWGNPQIELDFDAAVVYLREQAEKRAAIANDAIVAVPNANEAVEEVFAALEAEHRDEKERKVYVCSICQREFSNYHALGGHKAQHRRDKK